MTKIEQLKAEIAKLSASEKLELSIKEKRPKGRPKAVLGDRRSYKVTAGKIWIPVDSIFPNVKRLSVAFLEGEIVISEGGVK